MGEIQTNNLNEITVGGKVLKNNYLMCTSPAGSILKLETNENVDSQLKRTRNFEALKIGHDRSQEKDENNYDRVNKNNEDKSYFLQK